MRHTWTLTKIRIRLALRNRMFLFFSLIFPLGFLLFFTTLFGKGKTDTIAYVLGAVLTMTVMGSFWGLSVQLVIFREQGILRRFRLPPIGAGPILASSILSNYFLMIPTVAIEACICRWMFHMQSWGNLPVVFLLITVGSAAFSSFGLIVASVTNTMQETQIINQIIWMAFLFLSGATVPSDCVPALDSTRRTFHTSHISRHGAGRRYSESVQLLGCCRGDDRAHSRAGGRL